MDLVDYHGNFKPISNLQSKSGTTQMSSMVKELPTQYATKQVKCHNCFYRIFGRELEHWQKHNL